MLCAQSPAVVKDSVVVTSDTGEAYALFLPPGYSRDRKWPVLFVLDPRGRAALGLNLFRRAASELGYVVISSYNTLSDGPPEPNVRAMNAMLADAQATLSIDENRLYLAGFSGTSRAVLGVAILLKDNVRGVLADGAAVGFSQGGPELTFSGDSTFAIFASAGRGDFNFEEVRAFGERLRSTRVPYRFASFDGPHSWPPEATCHDALVWFETRAMLGGLHPLDTAFVRARIAEDRARAETAEKQGQLDEAAELYRAMERDYGSWSEASNAGERAMALEKNPALVAFRREAKRLADEDERQAPRMQDALRWVRDQRSPPTARTILDRLEVPNLQQRAVRGDSLESQSAKRQLARVDVFLSFYEPRTYLAKADTLRALRMLEAAVTVRPLAGESCALLTGARHAAAADSIAALSNQCR
jgi:predicted esterase